jgi:hypothetical protein
MFMKPEKLPKKVLKYIIKNLEEEYGDTRPTDSDVYDNSDVRDNIDTLMKMFGFDIPEHYEYGFYWLLYLNNRNKKDNEDLEIPKKHELTYYVDASVTKFATESYRGKTYTYSTRNSFNKDMMYSDDNWSYYEDEFLDDDVHDSESGDWNIVSYEYNIKESVKSKNTLSESKKLQLENLIKLRNELDKKIKNLL